MDSINSGKNCEHPCFSYSVEELKSDVEKQKEVFDQMFVALENHGKCRHVYHRLAKALTGDSLEG